MIAIILGCDTGTCHWLQNEQSSSPFNKRFLLPLTSVNNCIAYTLPVQDIVPGPR